MADPGVSGKASRHNRRRWLALAARVARLAVRQPETTADLISRSYDRIAPGYDEAWTGHMRHLTLRMLDRLDPPAGSTCVDLACGTGFLAGELARRTGGQVEGVDLSAGMLEVARSRHESACRFIHRDVVEYLRSQPSRSIDVVTCAWGLGYSRPAEVISQVSRVLRPGGRIGIVDNTLFSLAGAVWASLMAFAERPEGLQHVMRVRFLPSSCVLAAMMRWFGLSVLGRWDGSKRFVAADGQAAIERLTRTGAAAGFEFAADEGNRDAVFAAFARILDERRRTEDGIQIVHRYLAAVGRKP